MRRWTQSIAAWLRKGILEGFSAPAFDQVREITRSPLAERLIAQLRDQIGHCYSHKEIHGLQQALMYNVADFTTAEFLDTLRLIQTRERLLDSVQEIFRAPYYPVGELLTSYREADHALLQCLEVYTQQKQRRYTYGQHRAFKRAHQVRLEEIHRMTSTKTSVS